ncbi:hypothetical protein PANT_8c00015 [Moesziomyces antarcticus T-34]|uniref:AB hydrolase-1 domain-containing protein n=1 Tax=Pseudozyma antarctica (strain T-34) TaxID=1151754 RepID=M9LMV6_PSEA3|nr:hypothetical protein PANT_8c00015 [Moesziomyces antarcticus T-34]
MASFTDPFDAAGFSSQVARIPPPEIDPDVDVSIFYRRSPSSDKAKRGILLLHGHPQTHVIWADIALALAAEGSWDVVVPDNRGNGNNDGPAPKSAPGYSRYSKREMARDMVELMRQLGHDEFFVVAHDRGARIAHRMALDAPDEIKKLILLDIAPTLDMYEKTDDRFASVYWHWFFLLQPSIPERFILADPHAYYNALVTRFPRTTPSSGLGSAQTAVDEWRAGVHLANLSRESSVAAMCEDYRASAPADAPDLDLDRHDRQRGHKIACPLRVIWGKHGVIHALYDALDLWQKCAHQKVEGRALDCGHYIPEEAPHEVLGEIKSFFG